MEDKTLEILIIEDKEENLSTTTLLTKKGYSADIARNLAEAFEKLDGKRYDMVLTDMNFPIGKGRVSSPLRGDTHTEAPLGYSVILYAATKKVPYAAVVSDTDHHQGPIAATFDILGQVPFQINDTYVEFFDSRSITKNRAYLDCQTKDIIVEGEDSMETYHQKNKLYTERTGVPNSKITGAMSEKMFPQVKNWTVFVDYLLEKKLATKREINNLSKEEVKEGSE